MKKKTIIWKKYRLRDRTEDEKEDLGYDEDGEDIDDLPIMMNTALGIFRLDDDLNPFKMYEFHICHCNFEIDVEVVNALKTIEGVEVLHVMSRYRFILAVGECFEFADVKSAIEHKLCGRYSLSYIMSSIDNPEVRHDIVDIMDKCSPYQYWAMYAFPNGSIEWYVSDEKSEQYLGEVELLRESQSISGGIFITSEDINE